jgi:hypothetical protein
MLKISKVIKKGGVVDLDLWLDKVALKPTYLLGALSSLDEVYLLVPLFVLVMKCGTFPH